MEREQRIDYELVRAQMNGLDFDLRVLQPWARDPAYYQTVWTEMSDTPEHEGPAHHGLVELWTYSFPLSRADEQKLARELQVVPPLLAQARGNLTGNARDLWLTGIGTMQGQVESLDDLAARTKSSGCWSRSAKASAERPATPSHVTRRLISSTLRAGISTRKGLLSAPFITAGRT